jgi:hypothetical protein
MNIDEYKEKLAVIDKEHEARQFELAKEYALSNNSISAGDVITDHIGSIKVSSIALYMSHRSRPMCSYYGVQTTKKGKEYKSGAKRKVYQSNLV